MSFPLPGTALLSFYKVFDSISNIYLTIIFRELQRQFAASKKTQKDKMAAKCCLHEPLLDGDEDTEILDLIMIPELHLHLGMVNKIARVLNEQWGSDQFYRWCAEKNIHVKDYRSIQICCFTVGKAAACVYPTHPLCN